MLTMRLNRMDKPGEVPVPGKEPEIKPGKEPEPNVWP